MNSMDENSAPFRLLPPAAILDEMKGPKSAQFPSFRPRWPTNKLAGGNKRKSAKNSTPRVFLKILRVCKIHLMLILAQL